MMFVCVIAVEYKSEGLRWASLPNLSSVIRLKEHWEYLSRQFRKEPETKPVAVKAQNCFSLKILVFSTILLDLNVSRRKILNLRMNPSDEDETALVMA
jgi:hypothetical protein